MSKLKQEKQIKEISNYKYGFNDGDISYYNTGKGLNEDIINEISDHKMNQRECANIAYNHIVIS